MAVLGQALQQTDRGELNGSILITESPEGTEFYPLGVCKQRLQVGAWSMIKALYHVGGLIVESGTAGNTQPVGHAGARWPKRTLPKRLREATGMGELE